MGAVRRAAVARGRAQAGADAASPGCRTGLHLVRARSRDRAGNDAELALGLVTSDGTAPSVTAAVVGTPSATTRIAELSYTADDGAGVGLATGRPRVALVGRGDDADLAVPGESGTGAGAGEAARRPGASP